MTTTVHDSGLSSPAPSLESGLELLRIRSGATWSALVELGEGRDGIRTSRWVVAGSGINQGLPYRTVSLSSDGVRCPTRAALSGFEPVPEPDRTALAQLVPPEPVMVRAAVMTTSHVVAWVLLSARHAPDWGQLKRLRSQSRELFETVRREAVIPRLEEIQTQFVLLAEDHVQLRTSTCHRLLGPRDLEALFAAQSRPQPVRLERADVDLVRMGGPSGDALMGCVTPLRPVSISAAYVLTRAQKRVALRAAQGETLQEIAARLGIQHETARCHLREAYRRLSVSNRVELVAALNGHGSGRTRCRTPHHQDVKA
ncbi:MAG: response regulator transcription factor [Myxococcota bacterium]